MALCIAFLLGVPGILLAHCDTMDGPLIADARRALEKRDVTPILKWIAQDQEPQALQAFSRALAERDKGEYARQVSEMEFFETLVRLHRAAEGKPYAGIKPAGEADEVI